MSSRRESEPLCVFINIKSALDPGTLPFVSSENTAPLILVKYSRPVLLNPWAWTLGEEGRTTLSGQLPKAIGKYRYLH